MGSIHRKEEQIVLVADHSSAESAALQVRAMPVYEKPPARLVVGLSFQRSDNDLVASDMYL